MFRVDYPLGFTSRGSARRMYFRRFKANAAPVSMPSVYVYTYEHYYTHIADYYVPNGCVDMWVMAAALL